jgi:hypothetical protein
MGCIRYLGAKECFADQEGKRGWEKGKGCAFRRSSTRHRSRVPIRSPRENLAPVRRNSKQEFAPLRLFSSVWISRRPDPLFSFPFSLFPFPFPLSASASGDPGMAHAAIVGRSNVAVAVERSTASRRTKLRLELGFAFVQPLALFCRVSRTELRAHPLQTLRKAFTGLDLFGRIAARSGLAFYGSLPLCRRCGANTRRLVAVDSLEVELLQLRRGGARPIREGRDTVDFALEDRCGRLGIGRRPISSSQQRGNAKQGVRTHDTSLSIANWEPPVWRDNDRQGWRISWGSA